MTLRELLIRVGVTGEATEDLNRIDRATDKVKRGFSGLSALLTTLFAGGALKSLADAADEMQNLQSRIGSATGDIAGANAQLNDLTEHANANRMSIDAYADSWAKFETGMIRMGKTSDDTTQLVDGLSAAFRVNGTEGNTAAGALFQLTQSISGGTVQMEELNSLMDAQGNLYVSVAEEIGGTTTAFKKMVSQGKVTSKMLAESLIKQTQKYIAQLRDMPMTLGDVWVVVTNDVRNAINNVNDSSNIIPRLAKTLMGWWTEMKDSVSDFVEKLGGMDLALNHLMDTLKPLGAALGVLAGLKALALLTTPIGMTLALAAAIGLLYDDFMTWKRGGESLIDWEEWEPAIKQAMDAIDWVIDKFKELTGAKSDAEAVFNGIASAIALAFGVKTVGTIMGVVNAISQIGSTATGALGQLMILISAAQTASEYWDKFIDQTKDAQGNEKATTADGLFVKDSFFGRGYDAISDFWKSTPLGQGNLTGATQPAGVPLAPGNTPTRNVTNNVQAPTTVNAPITINAAPGQSVEDIGKAVQAQLSQTTASGFDPHSLMMNGGAK